MSTEQQWLDSLTDADKDQLLVDAYFKKSIADTANLEDIKQDFYKQGFNAGREIGRNEASIADTAGASKLVPHEPTKEMLEAGREQWDRMGFIKDIWQAMYCAAPPAPSVADQQFPYQKTFDAIAFATKIEGGGIAISVEKFRKAFASLAPSVADAAGAKSMVEFYKAARNDGYAEGYKAGVEFMRKNK